MIGSPFAHLGHQHRDGDLAARRGFLLGGLGHGVSSGCLRMPAAGFPNCGRAARSLARLSGVADLMQRLFAEQADRSFKIAMKELPPPIRLLPSHNKTQQRAVADAACMGRKPGARATPVRHAATSPVTSPKSRLRLLISNVMSVLAPTTRSVLRGKCSARSSPRSRSRLRQRACATLPSGSRCAIRAPIHDPAARAIVTTLPSIRSIAP